MHLKKIYVEEILKFDDMIGNTAFVKAVENTDFSFYHSSADKHNNIQEIASVPLDDPDILKMNMKSKFVFPKTSEFLRGCIRISKNNKS